MTTFKVVNIEGDIVVQDNNLRLKENDTFTSSQTLLFGSTADGMFVLGNGKSFFIIPRPNLRSYDIEPDLESTGPKKVIESIEELRLLLQKGTIAFIGEQLLLPVSGVDDFTLLSIVLTNEKTEVTVMPDVSKGHLFISLDQIQPLRDEAHHQQIKGKVFLAEKPFENITLVFPSQERLITQLKVILAYYATYDLELVDYYAHIEHFIHIIYGWASAENIIPFLQTHFPEKGNWSAIETD